ncbi:MAG TPA: glycogen debranching enzyme GlgX, partial [Verrucomicrobiae bacterium]|nr:glycogen debranching enzyme GlgX [Verrucomicrobiae bacterium]
RRKFFMGCRMIDGIHLCDIAWFDENLRAPAWDAPEARTICYQLYDTDTVTGEEDFMFIILNAEPRRKLVQLPDLPHRRKWCRVIDTAREAGDDLIPEGVPLPDPMEYLAASRSIVVLMGCEPRR